jgi:hypothetical protein
VIYFCRHCGSWLFSVVRNGEFAHVRLGILIYDPSIRPTFHIFVGSKAPWDTICDGLPQFAGLPDDGCASEYSASLGRRSCVSILLMEEKLGLAEDDFLAQLEIKCSLLTSQTRFCIGPSAHVGALVARIRYRRICRAGTRTPWQSWRQNIYVRKLDRLFGRTSWKFLRCFGNYYYWALRLLPEFPRMET